MWRPTGMSESSDSQLQTAACPLLGHKGLCYHRTHKQSLHVAAGMDCSGMHNSADRGRTFQKESRVFHPPVCFNCTALHLLPQTMREKTEKLWGEKNGGVEREVFLGRA